MNKLRYTLFLCLFSVMACGPMQARKNTDRSFSDKIIYGEDNRRDFFEVRDLAWMDLAMSTVAIMETSDIKPSSTFGHVYLDGRHYGKSIGLCSDEAFFDQPRVSFCSGFLVGPDILVTAGHCVRNEDECKTYSFVFGYSYLNHDTDPQIIPQDNVYGCKKLIKSQANGITGSDFAVVRLKRKVTGFQPLPIRTQDQLDNNDELTVIGYPSGLPGKFADKGKVRNNEIDKYFVTNLDTYGGNSGSAVINSRTRLVEGILVRGDQDYIWDTDSQCRRSNICPEDGCAGEEVTRISEILPHLSPKDF